MVPLWFRDKKERKERKKNKGQKNIQHQGLIRWSLPTQLLVWPLLIYL